MAAAEIAQVKAGAAQEGSVLRRLRQWAPAALLVAAMLLVYLFGWHKHLSFETIGRNYEVMRAFIGAHFVVALALFMLIYIASVALSLPTALILTVSGGLLFGWVAGGIAAVISATLGASILFLVVKISGGEALTRRAGPFVARLKDGFAENALSYMLFLRLVPVFPFFIVNLVPAMLGVPLRTFFIGTLLGIVPGTMAFSLAGSGLGSVIEAQNGAWHACVAKAGSAAACPYMVDTSALVTRELLAALAALGLVALIPIAFKAWSKRHAAT